MTDVERQILENQIAIMQSLIIVNDNLTKHNPYSLKDYITTTEELLNPTDVSCVNCKFSNTKFDKYPCCTCSGGNKWIKKGTKND